MKDINDLNKIIDINFNKMDISQKLKVKLIEETKNSYRIKIKKIGFISTPIIAAAVALILIINAFGPLKVYADNLMDGITPSKVNTVKLSKNFINSTADFSVELFKRSYTQGKNSLISPLSVYLALGMTANGADGNTLREFENVLGNQDLNINDLNSFYYTFSDKLKDTNDGKLYIANSIWYKDDKNLNIKKDFLQTNADYYNASAYKADFNDPHTVQDINNWVQNNTGKKIDKIINKIDPNTLMYLINAVYFKDEWKYPFNANEELHGRTFDLINGTEETMDFMYSTEIGFSDDKAQGFIKPYKNGRFSFAAILPNKGINIYDYVSSLSGESFMKLINNKTDKKCSIAMPKFKTECKVNLVDPLKQMGLKECFDDNADFSSMASDKYGNIYIGDIIQKTSISINEQGTEAAAAAKVEIETLGKPVIDLELNRPFLYAIIDNDTSLPLFIGIMMDPAN